jgi:hypothetical protein
MGVMTVTSPPGIKIMRKWIALTLIVKKNTIVWHGTEFCRSCMFRGGALYELTCDLTQEFVLWSIKTL